MRQIEITRRVEFDAGHRIPDHGSKCRNMHGHRYVLEATIRGSIKEEPDQPDTGMVQDFGKLKQLITNVVAEPWDHGFLVFSGDKDCLRALGAMPSPHKTIILDCVPTVENLARLAFERISEAMALPYISDQGLARVRLYETPNCWADYPAFNVDYPQAYTKLGGL